MTQQSQSYPSSAPRRVAWQVAIGCLMAHFFVTFADLRILHRLASYLNLTMLVILSVGAALAMSFSERMERREVAEKRLAQWMEEREWEDIKAAARAILEPLEHGDREAAETAARAFLERQTHRKAEERSAPEKE